MEAAEQIGFFALGGRQHFDGDDLAELMLGLVDAGHAAFAQTIEDLVVVEEESVGVAARQQLSLVFREILVGRHPGGEFRQIGGVLGLLLPASEHGLGFVDRQKLAAQQQTVNILHREFHVRPRSP